MVLTPPAEQLKQRRGAGTAIAEAEARVRELEDEVADLRAELGRSEARVEAMKQIQQTLGSNLAPDRLIRDLVLRTTELLGADRTTLFLIDRQRRELVSMVFEGDEAQEIRLSCGVGLAGWVAEHEEPLHIRDAYTDERFNPKIDKETGYRTRCMLVWPVRRPRGAEVTGVIQVLNKLSGTFDATDERLLEAISSSIGVALEVMTLYQEAIERTTALERARDKVELLFETERAITEATDLESALDAILTMAMDRLEARSAIVYLLDERDTGLEVVATAGSYRASLAKMKVSPDDPVLGAILSTGEPIAINDDARVKRGRARVRRLIAVAITHAESGRIGVLELLNRKSDAAYTPNDLKALSVVASQAGRAIHAERQREMRERASRLAVIGRMLSGVVHDLRTPMTLINGYTELLAASHEPTERQGYARGILKQVEVMSAMTRDLLGFARGERSTLVRKVYVKRFMAEMHEYLARELDGKEIDLSLDVRYTGPARFDETKVRRVFHNIARNAVEAMPGGGKFAVQVAKSRDDLVLEFVDTGPGIPEELGNRVFDAFSTAGKAGGTGLGLAMVKRVAEEHRGTVICDSAPGEGTRFVLTIPLGL